MNIHYRDVARTIWEVDASWTYDDSNATTLPHGYTSLVHNQHDYALPSTAQVIDRIEVLDHAGNYIKLNPLDPVEVKNGLPEYLGGSPGLPLNYVMRGRSIVLYPTPHSAYVTLTDGIHIYVNREITEIALTASTGEPGFAQPFHRILSYACSIDFTQDAQQRQFFALQKEALTQAMLRFYAKRAPENKTTVKPNARRRWRKYT